MTFMSIIIALGILYYKCDFKSSALTPTGELITGHKIACLITQLMTEKKYLFTI